MHTTRIHRLARNLAWALATSGLCGACMSSQRPEPAGSATSASSNKPSQYAMPPPPAASRDEQSEASKPKGMQRAHGAAPAPAAAPVFAEPSKQNRATSAPATGRARGEAPKPSAADKDKKASGAGEEMLSQPDDMRVDPLVPTLADPPDIRTALQDLQGAAEMLAAGHGCDEGCRAFQSMQRAAARICDLVSSRDPLQRCASARTKVSAAEHDIKDRCGSC